MINLQEEKDLLNTVEISARRFEESPFIERHDTSKMIKVFMQIVFKQYIWVKIPFRSIGHSDKKH